MKITKHKIFKDATEQADWLNEHLNWKYNCRQPQSHISHLSVWGGRFNVGNAANIWYRSKGIDLYDVTILDIIKEFAKVFEYENIEIYES